MKWTTALSEPARRELNVLLRQLQPNESTIALDSHLQKRHREIADFLVNGDFVTKTGVYQFDLRTGQMARRCWDARTVEEYDNRQNKKGNGQALVTDGNHKKPEVNPHAAAERWPEAEDVVVAAPAPAREEPLWQPAPPELPEQPKAVVRPAPAWEQMPDLPKEELKEQPKKEEPLQPREEVRQPAKEEAKKTRETVVKEEEVKTEIQPSPESEVKSSRSGKCTGSRVSPGHARLDGATKGRIPNYSKRWGKKNSEGRSTVACAGY